GPEHAPGRPVPEALPQAPRRGHGEGASGAPPSRVQAAGAGGEELRGDQRDHRREPRYGEEPAPPRPQLVRPADRALPELGAPGSGGTGGPAEPPDPPSPSLEVPRGRVRVGRSTHARVVRACSRAFETPFVRRS